MAEWGTLWRRLGGWLRMWGAYLVLSVFIAIADEIGPLKAVERWMEPRQDALLVPVIGLGVLGFVIFMGCTLHLLLRPDKRLGGREWDELRRRSERLHRPMGKGKRDGARPTGSLSLARNEASFTEVKTAWRIRAWEVSTRWRRFFLWGFSALLMFLGLFGFFIVVGPIGLKLILLGVVAFVFHQVIRGFRRA